MNYRQLTLDERYQIQVYLKQGLTQAQISRELARSPSTICRELRRNSDPVATHPYLAQRAMKLAHYRRKAKGEACRKVRGELQHLVEEKLRLSWSPEQISGRLRLERGIRISHETIYQHVLRDSMRQGYLRYCLRFGGYKHHRFKKSHMAERTRLRKHWLDQRPAGANERTEIGHWERDCIVGPHGGAVLLTVVDRRSRYTRVRRVSRQDVEHVAEATLDALAPHRKQTKTVTNDNGVEFQRDETLQKQLGVPVYFTDPSSPWQRGSVENANGLIRQYVPKRSRIDDLPEWTPTALEETLNFRPRKILGFRTPHEAFYGEQLSIIGVHSMHFGLEFSSASCFGTYPAYTERRRSGCPRAQKKASKKEKRPGARPPAGGVDLAPHDARGGGGQAARARTPRAHRRDAGTTAAPGRSRIEPGLAWAAACERHRSTSSCTGVGCTEAERVSGEVRSGRGASLDRARSVWPDRVRSAQPNRTRSSWPNGRGQLGRAHEGSDTCFRAS